MNKTEFLNEMNKVLSECGANNSITSEDNEFICINNIKYTNRKLNILYKKMEDLDENRENLDDLNEIIPLKLFWFFKDAFERIESDTLRNSIMNQWYECCNKWDFQLSWYDGDGIPEVDDITNEIIHKSLAETDYDDEQFKMYVFHHLRGSKAKKWDFCKYFSHDRFAY